MEVSEEDSQMTLSVPVRDDDSHYKPDDCDVSEWFWSDLYV